MTTYKFDEKLDAAIDEVAKTNGTSKQVAVAKAIAYAVPTASGGAATEVKASTRLTLAYVLLVGVAALFGASGYALVTATAEHMLQAQTLFEFAKVIGPPIVTLIIGYYFSKGDNG